MVRNRSYEIVGRVRRARPGGPPSELRVEVWDRDRRGQDIIGAAFTDRSGRFRLAFDSRHLERLGLDDDYHLAIRQSFAHCFRQPKCVAEREPESERQSKSERNAFGLDVSYAVSNGISVTFRFTVRISVRIAVGDFLSFSVSYAISYTVSIDIRNTQLQSESECDSLSLAKRDAI